MRTFAHRLAPQGMPVPTLRTLRRAVAATVAAEVGRTLANPGRPLDDVTTNQTLYRFYRALRDQGLAAFATQKLDREMRRHGLGAPSERPFADPYYWAAFVVIAND
jgi:hypothetical protein